MSETERDLLAGGRSFRYSNPQYMLKRLLILFGYLAIFFFVAAGTLLLVAYGRGYSYDLGSHKLVQRGLILISSNPSGATLFAQDKETKKRTPYRANVKPGSYEFSLFREGYRPWRKTLLVEPGQVTNAQYVLLVPEKLRPQALVRGLQPGATAISRDHRHLAYLETGALPGLYTVDLPDGKPRLVFAAPVATPGLPAERLTGVDWSDDASHLLLTSELDGRGVVRVAAADGSEIINLTERYRLQFSGLKFSPGNSRQLYWNSPEGLRRLDLTAQTVSAVLAPNVFGFTFGDDRLIYIQATPLGKSVFAFPLNDPERKQELVQSVGESDAYQLTFGSFRGREMLSVIPSRSRTATLYSGFFDGQPVAHIIARDVDNALFPAGGQYLALWNQRQVQVYDVEHSRPERPVLYTQPNGAGLLGPTWFDDFHLLTSLDGKVRLVEFDGANGYELDTAAPGQLAFSTGDLRHVMYFAPGERGLELRNVLIRP